MFFTILGALIILAGLWQWRESKWSAVATLVIGVVVFLVGLAPATPNTTAVPASEPIVDNAQTIPAQSPAPSPAKTVTTAPKESEDDRAVRVFTSGKVSNRGGSWLTRFGIDLLQPETAERRSTLSRSCAAARDWHTTKPERHPQVHEDWIILARICNRALPDGKWTEAQGLLQEAKP